MVRGTRPRTRDAARRAGAALAGAAARAARSRSSVVREHGRRHGRARALAGGRAAGRGAPSAGCDLGEPFRRRPNRRDRPDHRADPAAGVRCRCRVTGAVRMVPHALRPDWFPRRPGGGGGSCRRAGCSRRGGPLGHPALGVRLARRQLAGVHRPRPRRPRGARRRSAGRPHRTVRLEPGRPRSAPWPSGGATGEGSSRRAGRPS